MAETIRIKTDLAVVGGGTAGVNTAMAAAQRSLNVTVIDKANIDRSGAIAGGIDHWHAYLETGEPWDTREVWLKFIAKVGRGASNLKIHEKVYCDEMFAAIDRVESLGISLRDERTGDFYRVQALGQPGPFAINFKGKRLKPAMAKEVRRLGCRVLDRVQVTKLVLHDGEFAGILGFNMRTGDFYEIQAKACVIATGNTNRMYRPQAGNPFNIWYCPACTGDLHRAAFNAGVEMANMEYTRMTVVPKGFSAPGFNAFLGMGSKLVNSLGEHYMERYHPDAEIGPRNFVVWGTWQEIKDGRGPVYMDCRHLGEDDRMHLFKTLGYDKDTLPDFFIKKGYNLAGTMIEVTVSEPMQARPGEQMGSGVKIDESCASNVPGIFAAGDSSDQMGCLHMCVAGGYAAGKRAADFVQKAGPLKPVNREEAVEEKDRVFEPLNRKSGISYTEFENVVRQITTDNFGPVKTEISLNNAIDKLSKLGAHQDDLQASNLHELMRVHEAISIQEVAIITASAALVRKETRFPPYHYRADFPDTDDENYCGLMVVKKGNNGQVDTRFEKLTYDI
jgi:adenylylsulfate reductase subunit A